MLLLILCLVLFSPKSISEAFSIRQSSTGRQRSLLSLHPSSGDTKVTVDALLADLDSDERDEREISIYISDLEDKFNPPKGLGEEARFKPLVGLYEVAYIKTTKMGDNPVGGKWTRPGGLAQKILKNRRTFQHITAANSTGCGTMSINGRKVVGEAINVLSFDALWGLCRCFVILRGDAIALNDTERLTNLDKPLSNVAVKALFDAPRIALGKTGGWLNINVGPRSSVLLDASYVDEKLRIGVGGMSGTRFVFKRCEEGDEEANEFRAILSKKPLTKLKALSTAAATGTLGVVGTFVKGLKIIGCIVVLLSALVASLVAFSSGGIEPDGVSTTLTK